MEGIQFYKSVDAMHVYVHEKIYIKFTVAETKEPGSRFIQALVSDNPTNFSKRDVKTMEKIDAKEFKEIMTKAYEPFSDYVEDFLGMMGEV